MLGKTNTLGAKDIKNRLKEVTDAKKAELLVTE